jgi:mannose-1-phosphate guanylyltransferase
MARYAVILAGGGGTRLWPASRRKRPKQFLPLGAREGESLLGATARRAARIVGPTHVWVVTAAEQVAEIARATDRDAVPDENVLAEPCARNTAAAVGLAAARLAALDPDATLAILPADHHIGDEAGFARVLGACLTAAERDDALVTCGIKPAHPETGFGYIEVAEGVTPSRDGALPVARFVEKPNLERAREFLASGRFYWNSGMFFFRARRILAEIARTLPPLGVALDEIAATLRGAGTAAAAEATARLYPTLPSVSIDTGVMEKAAGIQVVPGDFGWNDVGSWRALAEVRARDAAGNVHVGQTIAVDTTNSVLVAEPGRVVAAVGVTGLVVVATPDAVLVIPADRAQDVRRVVDELEKRSLKDYL